MEKNIKDLWTSSKSYAEKYQPEQEIESVVNNLNISSGMSIADVGCGNGAFSIRIAEKFPECQIYASDVLETAIWECEKRKAEKELSNITTSVFSTTKILLPSQCVDRVLSRSVMHHVENLELALTEFNRVLKEDGVLLMQFPCNIFESDFSIFLQEFHMLMDETHKRWYRQPCEIIQMLENENFYIQSTEHWPYEFSVNEKQMEKIIQCGFEKRLQLDVENKKMISYWIRVIAPKVPTSRWR